MANMSNYLESKLIDHIFRGISFTAPATLAVALCVETPSDSSTGATIDEVANSSGYARATWNPSESNWTEQASGATHNTGDIEFPVATGAWGTITSIAILDSATYGAGNLLFWADLEVPKVISAGKKFIIPGENLDIQLDD